MKFSESFAGVATSATRVIEMYYPEDKRLFNDQFAYKLLPFGWRVFVRLFYLPGLRSLVLSLRERRMPGSLGGILCRTRYIDDVLKRSLEEGIDQLVILGAGFDSRAYRIAGMDQVQVLKAAGFHKGKRTLFIWEGVTQYITAEAVNNTLEFVTSVSGVGSAIVFTYVRRGLIDGTDCPEWFPRFQSFARRVGSPLIFGLDPVELGQYLADRGLKLIDDVGAAEYQERYLVPLGREMSVFEGERVAFAEVKRPLAT